MKKNNKKGFTLVELVIVVAVMAVLVAVAIPTVSSITKSAQDAVAESNARTIESVIKLAEANAANLADTGVASLKSADVAKAVYEAKLGLTTTGEGSNQVVPTFYYKPATGEVSATAPATADAANWATITFGATGQVSVTAVPGHTPADSATSNYAG